MISSGKDTEQNGNTQNDNSRTTPLAGGKGRGMTEDNTRPPTSTCTLEADCNSNNTTLDNAVSHTTHITPSQLDGDDILAAHDAATGYQWLLDLGGGGGGRDKYPTSIFSLSPLQHDLSYDDLARNIDANLAEIDMEDFRSEDIHSILALPAMYCGSDFQPHKHGENFASVSGSLLLKFDAIAADDMSPETPCKTSAATTITTEEEADSSGDVSMCKSEPLFSPVKEAPLMLPSFSVDSLDCESYDEQELMLTCQANKNNYTIAFEGSFTQYSEDSDYHDAGGSDATDSNSWSGRCRLPNVGHRGVGGTVDNSMVQSDYVYTTWSKLKHMNDVVKRKNVGRGEGGPRPGPLAAAVAAAASKSQSLPNLLRQSLTSSEIRLSQLNISLDSDQCVPVYDVQSSQSSHSRASSETSQHSFSLVRLFIQQKGTSSLQGSVHNDSICQSQTQSMYLNGPEGSQVPINRPNPNVCSSGTRDKAIKTRPSSNASLDDLQLAKEDVVLRQKNLICDNEKGTNVSGPVSPLGLVPKSNSGWDDKNGQKISASRYHLLPAGRESPLEDSLIESKNAEASSPVDDNEDVEMTSLEGLESCKNNADVINNCLRVCKSNGCQLDVDAKFIWRQDLNPESASHGTQTKVANSKENSPLDGCGPNDQYPEVLNNARGDSGPISRLRRSSPGFINNAQNDRGPPPLRRRLNVTIAAMKSTGTQIPVHVIDQAVQTSVLDDLLGKDKRSSDSGSLNVSGGIAAESVSQPSQTDSKTSNKRAVYVCYPNYSLPDLSFLRSSLTSSLTSGSPMYLMPQMLRATLPSLPDGGETSLATQPRRDPRPQSCPEVDSLRQRNFQHVRDWDSLNILLPREVRHMLGENSNMPDPATDVPHFCRDRSHLRVQTSPGGPSSDGGSCLYRYDNPIGDKNERPNIPPPLPKRSISLPNGRNCQKTKDQDQPPSSNGGPKSILRKPSPSRSDSDSQLIPGQQRYSLCDMPTRRQIEDRLGKRHSLQETGNEYTLDPRVCYRGPSMEPQQCNGSIVLSAKSPAGKISEAGDGAKTGFRSRLSAFLAASEPLSDACALAAILPTVSFSPDGSSTGTLDFDKEDACGEDEGSNCCEHGCCSCERARGKKSVSFSERVCVRETCTPEGSPDAAALHVCKHQSGGNCNDQSMTPSPTSEDGENPPNEFSISPPTGTSPSDIPTLLPSQPLTESPFGTVDFTLKKNLVLSVSRAASVLVNHFSQTKDSQEKYQLGSTSLTPACGHKVLEFLCPAMFSVLNDGLQPQLYSYFGSIQNSVWRVVEASVQFGPTTRALNDLVTRLNSEDSLRDPVVKLNAFILGLLNIRSLDSWFAYICSQQATVQKHYQPTALISLATTIAKPLLDELLTALQPLSTLPFELDLFFEQSVTNNHYANSSPTATATTKQQQQQQSLNDPASGLGKETKDYQNQQARQQATKPVECSNDCSTEPILRGGHKPVRGRRPKSCIEQPTNNNFSLTDIASQVKKRWSGTNINSKIINAFDKMILDPQWTPEEDHQQPIVAWATAGDEGYYPSAGTNAKPPMHPRPKPEGAVAQQSSVGGYKGAANLADGLGDVEFYDDVANDDDGDSNQFKLLQRKWEELSAKPDNNKVELDNVNLNVGGTVLAMSNAGNKSRIPRLMTPRGGGGGGGGKLDESAVSLRSSGSGQSVNCQETSTREKPEKEQRESLSDVRSELTSDLLSGERVHGIQRITSAKHPASPLRNPRGQQQQHPERVHLVNGRPLSEGSSSPRKRPLPMNRASSIPQTTIGNRGGGGIGAASSQPTVNYGRRPPSPLKHSRSGLPRKMKADDEAVNAVQRRK